MVWLVIRRFQNLRLKRHVCKLMCLLWSSTHHYTLAARQCYAFSYEPCHRKWMKNTPKWDFGMSLFTFHCTCKNRLQSCVQQRVPQPSKLEKSRWFFWSQNILVGSLTAAVGKTLEQILKNCWHNIEICIWPNSFKNGSAQTGVVKRASISEAGKIFLWICRVNYPGMMLYNRLEELFYNTNTSFLSISKKMQSREKWFCAKTSRFQA